MKNALCYTHSLCFFVNLLRSRVAIGSTVSKRLRATPEIPTVECLYAKKAISYSNGSDATIDQCINANDGRAIDLPRGIAGEHKLSSGRTRFKIHGARITKDQHNVDKIAGLENASVEVIETHNGRNLAETTTTGNHTVLVVRVASLDSNVVYNATTLGKLIFDDGVTFKGMYNACSFGKLKMVPYQGPGVVNGVAELSVDSATIGVSPRVVENLAMPLIQTTYGLEGVAYDHLMIMLPSATFGSWFAYSYVNAYRSVFNNLWSGSVSTNVHEVGHTLGLNHSSRNGNEYLDQTGYMGYSSQMTGSPSKCFNGHKNYVLGWYADRILDIRSSSLPWNGNLVTFVDYDKAYNNEPVLIKIDDYYLQYNRAKSFNFQTTENRNEITVTRAPDPFSISSAVGSLSMSNTTFTLANYQGSESLLVEVCSQQFVSDNSRADLYKVSIHLKSQPSGCSSPSNVRPRRPTRAPIAPPTRVPTTKPTTVTPKPRPNRRPSRPFN